MFVGDFHNGNLYHFDLDKDKKELALNGQLADKIPTSWKEPQDIIFGHGFDRSTDIEIGPDGYLYVVSIHLGSIYRIMPNNTTIQTSLSSIMIHLNRDVR
jgi:aldose sugar dehydrogenase